MRGAIEQCGTDRDRSGCRGPGKGLACLGRPPFPDGQVRLSRFTAPPTLAGLDRLSDRLRGFPGRRWISLSRWAFPDVWSAFASSQPTAVAVLTRWPDLLAGVPVPR